MCSLFSFDFSQENHFVPDVKLSVMMVQSESIFHLQMVQTKTMAEKFI